MEYANLLKEGTVRAIYMEEYSNPLTKEPVLQILKFSGPQNASSEDERKQNKLRVLLADGQHFIAAVIPDWERGREVDVGAIVHVKKYRLQSSHWRGNTAQTKILLTEACEVIAKSARQHGSPRSIDTTVKSEIGALGNSTTVDSKPIAHQQRASSQPSSQPSSQYQRPPPYSSPPPAYPGMGNSGGQNAGASNYGARGTVIHGASGNDQNSSSVNSYGSRSTAPNRPPSQPAQPVHAPVKQEQQTAICPISNISPYLNKCAIKGRVTNKSDIKTWSNTRGTGKLFNVTLMDESGEIRVTGFNEQVDQFYNVFQENKIYYVSRTRVTFAKKQFSNVNHDYELTLEAASEVRPCTEDASVPTIKFDFVKIGDIMQHEKDANVDVIGIVKEDNGISSIISKTTQKPLSKRELTIVDQSIYQIRLTLWGKQAETFDGAGSPVVACKGVRVGEYGGRNLSMYTSAVFQVDPDIPEAHELRSWYDSTGQFENFKYFSGISGSASGGGNRDERKTIEQVKSENYAMSDKAEYFSTKATILFIRTENFCYPACPVDGKKVIEEGLNSWRCEKCSKSYDAPEYRYVMSITVADHTDQAWLQCFNDIAAQLIGKSAGELFQLKLHDESAFAEVIQEANFKTYVFRCRAKTEMFNDTQKVRYTIITAHAVDHEAESGELLRLIGEYNV